MALPAAQGSAAAARARPQAAGGSRPEGASPAAQALGRKASWRFLALFRKQAAESSGKAQGAERLPAPASAAKPAGSGQSSGPAGKPVKNGQAGPLQSSPGAKLPARRVRRPKAAGGVPSAEAASAALSAAPGRKARAAAAQEPPAPQGSAAPAAVAAKGRRAAPQPAVRVTVTDQRTSEPEAHRETRRGSEQQDPAARFERVLLRGREAGPAAEAARGGPASQPSALPRSLQERLVPELVRHAGIILRDGGEGEIRLVLRPENLGSVRIRLQLGESSLEGRIVVDNRDVKELLDANLEQLKTALRQEGYASANIDVTVSGGRGERRDLGPLPPAASARRAEQFEASTPAFWDLGSTTVNLFV